MITDHRQFKLFGRKTFEKARMQAPFRMVAEMSDEACFFFITEGKVNVYSPLAKCKFQANEGVVLKCGTYLNEVLDSSDLNQCEAIAIHLYPEVLKRIYDHDLPDFLTRMDDLQKKFPDRVPSSHLLHSYIQNLQFYFENPQLVSEELLILKLKELLLLLAKTNNISIIRALVSGIYAPDQLDFKEIIEANIFNNLSLEELASLANRSLSTFKRDFHKTYGTTPARYIKKRKLDKAEKLIKGTNLRITQIAFECGFNDLAHFSKSFQKEYGVSPKQVRA